MRKNNQEALSLWAKFEEIPTHPSTRRINTEFVTSQITFPQGTPMMDILKWFESQFKGFSCARAMFDGYNKDGTEKAEWDAIDMIIGGRNVEWVLRPKL